MIKIRRLKFCSNYKGITIHQRNLQVLMTEVYKIVKGELLPIIRHISLLRTKNTVRYGSETTCYRTPRLWPNTPKKGWKVKMDGAPVLLHCPKTCCKLSFSGFLPLTVPYWN